MSECLHGKTGEVVSNLVVRAWYVCDAYVKVIGGRSEVKGPDQGHKIGAFAGACVPYGYHCRVVAVEKDVSSARLSPK